MNLVTAKYSLCHLELHAERKDKHQHVQDMPRMNKTIQRKPGIVRHTDKYRSSEGKKNPAENEEMEISVEV